MAESLTGSPGKWRLILTGSINVNGDCTAEADFIYNDPAYTGTAQLRGVFFDYGDRAFAVPLFTVLADGTSLPFQGWTYPWKSMSSFPVRAVLY